MDKQQYVVRNSKHDTHVSRSFVAAKLWQAKRLRVQVHRVHHGRGLKTYAIGNLRLGPARNLLHKADRCDRGARAVGMYATIAGLKYDPVETQLCDMLTDLRHFCDAFEIDLDECIAKSKEAFEEERAR